MIENEGDNRNYGRCFGCGADGELTKEHIFLNAIGGHQTARVLCKTCNSGRGEELDDIVAKQLSPLSTLFGVRRTRGKNRDVVVTRPDTGEQFALNQEKKAKNINPQFGEPRVQIDEKKSEITISACSSWQLAKSLQKLRSQYDFSQAKTTRWQGKDALGEVCLPIRIGGRPLMRGVAKTAYTFLAHSCPSRDEVMSSDFNPIRRFIFEDEGSDLAAFNYRYTQQLATLLPIKGKPLHAVCVHYDSYRRNVIGFVQLFGTLRFAVLLASEYPWNCVLPDSLYYEDPTDTESNKRSPLVITDLNAADALHPGDEPQLVQSQINQAIRDAWRAYNGQSAEPKIAIIPPSKLRDTDC